MTVVPTPQEARGERVRREKARRSLISFQEYVGHPWYRPGRHHQLVARYLEQVALYVQTKGAQGIGRLMIEEPPRHGKTQQVAEHFPAWLIGRDPDLRFIVTSYGANLAEKSSRSVRNTIASQRYQAVFGELSAVDTPVTLADDSRSISQWDLSEPHRGGMVAAGVGGGLTGSGAHVAIIDDPFKNREEAESEAHQERVWKWYGSTLYTRLEDAGAIILPHTRWDVNDLSGRLLKATLTDPQADKWVVLCLPALALESQECAEDELHQKNELAGGLWLDVSDPLERAPGEALWPEKYGRDDLLRIKANLDAVNLLDWPALYQALPRPIEGAFFNRNDFEIIEPERVPQGLTWVRYVDLALSERKTADFNATVAEALAPDGTLFLRDMMRVRGWLEFKGRLIAAMLSDMERGVVWGIEDVAFQWLAFQELASDPQLANVAIRAVPVEGDKVTRARPLQARAAGGKVKLVRGSWNAAFIAEAVEFPNGRKDDQIDTASGGLKMIAELSKQVEPRVRWL